MNIPKCGKEKYILIFSDKNSGVILNLDGSYYTNEGDNFYQVFDNINEAKEKAREKMNDDLEILLYDGQGVFIELFKT